MVQCDGCGVETKGHPDSTRTQVRGPDGEWIPGWGTIRLLSIARREPVSTSLVLCESCFDAMCKTLVVRLIELGAPCLREHVKELGAQVLSQIDLDVHPDGFKFIDGNHEAKGE